MSQPKDQTAFGELLSEDEPSPINLEWNRGLQVIKPFLANQGCVSNQDIYGCTGKAQVPLYPIPWYELRQKGIGADLRTSTMYWTPACRACNLLHMSLRFRVMSTWCKIASRNQRQSYQKARVQYSRAKEQLLDCIGPDTMAAEINLAQDLTYITTTDLTIDGYNITIPGRITYLDTTSIRSEGKVVVYSCSE